MPELFCIFKLYLLNTMMRNLLAYSRKKLSIIITPFWINKISGPTFDVEKLGAVARQDLFMAGIQKETLDR